MRVLAIAPRSFRPLDTLGDALGDGVELVIAEDVDAVRDTIRDADAVVVHPRLGGVLRDAWSGSTNLRWIHALSAGVESILFDELAASEVVLTNGRGVFASALAEFAMAAILHFAKDVPRLARNQSLHRWEPATVQRIEGLTLGVVGYGAIGQAVGRIAAAFGMNVVATRRRAAEGGPITTLDDLLTRSDYVVVTVPITPATRGLLGDRELRLMKPSAVLVNIGRGAVVDEAALVDALRAGRMRGAALDVFAEEPLPADHPFWSLENVLLSPHCADHTPDSHDRAMASFLENLARFRKGEELVNIVDKAAQY